MSRVILASACVVALMVGCATVARVGGGLAAATGVITTEQAESISRAAEAAEKAFEDITPEQEYYIGRAVGANITKSYKVYDAPAATRYVNLLGQSLALASTKPETFGGYRFLILDSSEINAFAAPGGHIFITRGMLRLCGTESALAAVLAHEIAHVQYQHGLKSIKNDRLVSAFAIIGAETAKSLGTQELRQLTTAFEGSITDVTRTLVNSGYSREAEAEADAGAVAILKRTGYNPLALIHMLEEMDRRLKPGGLDFAKTHPDPADRIESVRKLIGSTGPVRESETVKKRFGAAMAGI